MPLLLECGRASCCIKFCDSARGRPRVYLQVSPADSSWILFRRLPARRPALLQVYWAYVSALHIKRLCYLAVCALKRWACFCQRSSEGCLTKKTTGKTAR